MKYHLRSKGPLFDSTPPDSTDSAQPTSGTTQSGTARTSSDTARPHQSSLTRTNLSGPTRTNLSPTRTNQTELDKMAEDEARDDQARLEREARERARREEEEHLTDDDMDVFLPRTLREFNVPRAGDVRGAIRLPRIPGQQPNFNPGVVNMVQQTTFHGLDHEDPHAHLQTFLECITTIKTNGENADYTKLALFPFTLRDKAKKWLGSLPRDSILTWRELSKLFLTRFFPHKRTAKVRHDLTSFRQIFDEPLNEAWERFRELQYSCPHHDILDWLLIQTFYDGLNESTRASVDAVAGGALMSREPLEAMNLIDSMAQNQQWSGRDDSRQRGGQGGNQGGGKYEVDHITALTAKMDAMQKAMDKLSVKAVEQQPQVCVMCGDERHAYEQCPLVQQDEESEQVNSLNNEPSFFPRPPNNRPYSKDPVEQQNWRSNQNNPAPFNNSSSRPPFNNNNFQRPPYNNSNNWNNPSGGNNRNFFPNQNNRAPQSDPSEPCIDPAVSTFMHEQGKMNQMVFEQMQAMNAQLMDQNKMLIEQMSH